MGLEQRCIECLYFSCLLNIGLTQLKHQSSSMHYIGNFPYRHILSFVKGNQSCVVSSQNMLSILKKEVHDQDESVSDYTCLLFLDDDLSEENSVLRIRDVYAEIHEYDVEYKFRLNPFKCKLEKDLPNVNLFLTCFQRKDYVAKTCQNGKGCDDDLEFCQHNRDFQKSICIPKRKYNESCGMHSQCYKNTICTQTEQRKSLCLCKEGFEFMNGDCLKVGLVLNKECIDSQQCIGGEFTTVCVFDVNKTRRVCSCKTELIESNGKCLQKNRRLYQPCESSLQCRGTHGAKECRYVEGVKLCYCPDGYDIIGSTCSKAERLLFDTCEYDVQCNGTEGANNCTTFGERKICFCKTGHLEFQGRCIAGKRHLGDPCEITKQCLNEEDTCNVICGNNSSCSCKDGYFEVGQECLKGNLSLGQSCVESSQCTGTEDSGRCVDGQCSCEMGFHLYKRQCIPGKKHLFLLVGAGVLLLVITVSIITCLVVCRGKLKARSGRLVVHTTDNVLEDHNYYTYATHGNIRDTMESQIPLSHNDCSYTGDTLYDTTHHAEEQTTENLYDVSEPLSTFRDQASSEGVYMYNHLHDKETAV